MKFSSYEAFMPEGPEVRRYALQLAKYLDGEEILHFSARTQNAKKFLLQHISQIVGRRILAVRSHGKHLYGIIEGGIGFHSHLMMWGRWNVYLGNEEVAWDKRERARIVVPQATAVLLSAPVFEVFYGNPFEEIENLRTLGPDVLPMNGLFDAREFGRRLQLPENSEREIGAVLLDQRVCAGIGNYFRADVLFACRLNPWKKVALLTPEEITRLSQEIPLLAQRSLAEAGVSVGPDLRARLLQDPTLHYNGRIVEWAARHAVFRRTNLPCLICGQPIKQKQQVVYRTPDGDSENEPANEKARTIYFCPNCQDVNLESLATPQKQRAGRHHKKKGA